MRVNKERVASDVQSLVMVAKARINQLTNWELLKHWDYYQYIVGVLENPTNTLEGPMYSKRQIIRLVDFCNGATYSRSIPNSEVNSEFLRLAIIGPGYTLADGRPVRREDYPTLYGALKGVQVAMRDPKGPEC